jgi:hypothetical protein
LGLHDRGLSQQLVMVRITRSLGRG